ncbi:MAG TPA: PilN domain-containing protein [Terriglobales bacterium]|nr:PilN domain-containing protein [Terriglobales bacterium]
MQSPNVLVIALVLIAITAGGNYAWYWMLDRDGNAIRTQIRQEEDKNRRLADIKAKYLELEKQKNHYEHRVNVINELAKRKKGPSELLNTIAETVNRTDAVWLNTMSEDGDSVSLQGVALSVNAVARLMQNLRSTGRFRTVEIKETFQDEVTKEVQAFEFTLICERQTSEPQKI